LIAGIVVPALIIIFLLFKPAGGKQRNRYDYDRNRGYDTGASPYDRPRSRYDYDRDDYYNRDRGGRDRYYDDRDRRDRYYDDRDDRRYY
jgi:hypothetical protein